MRTSVIAVIFSLLLSRVQASGLERSAVYWHIEPERTLVMLPTAGITLEMTTSKHGFQDVLFELIVWG